MLKMMLYHEKELLNLKSLRVDKTGFLRSGHN